MTPKAHLSSQSWMFGSWWMTTSLWLSPSLIPYLYSSSVYSYDCFLISSTSVMSLLFLSFILPILAWNVPLFSPIFLKRFLVFHILWLITCEGEWERWITSTPVTGFSSNSFNIWLEILYIEILDHIPKTIYMLLEWIIDLTMHLKYYLKWLLIKYGDGVINRKEISTQFYKIESRDQDAGI